MVGQMLILGFRGTELAADNPIVADIRQRRIGGVVLFSTDVPSGGSVRNIESPAQVTDLCAALQEEGDGTLLISIDQEGGRVARLGPDHGFPETRSAAELGELGDPEIARNAGQEIAATLGSVGVNLNFAPVVDLNTNPGNPVIGGIERAFSADPETVTALAGAFVEGHRAEGILTTLKHFPGHGSSEADSHLGFVDVTETWSPEELDPYRALIAAGQADLVMAAHVFNAGLDEDYPASLSTRVIGDLLRGELGFAGVVVSDDMQMGAITENWAFEEAIRLAVAAGADLLIYGNNIGAFDPTVGRRAFETILGLVESGEIAKGRIEESYARIRELKTRAGIA